MTDTYGDDFGNQNIDMEANSGVINEKYNIDNNNNNNYNNNNINNNNNNNNNIIQSNILENKAINSKIEDEVGKKITEKATQEFTKTWIEKYLFCFNFLKKYFNITTGDFYKRFLYSLIPFNHRFQQEISNNPDIYGPFWIYTFLILEIASCGSLTRFIQGDNTKNFFQKFIPIATIIIYSFGFGLPLIIYLLMKMFGGEIIFVNVLCTYGYSYSIFIFSVLLCVITWQPLQWILLGYSAFSSTSLLVVNYWQELGKFVNKRRIIICVIVLCVQVAIFIIFKFYFFKKFTEGLNNDDDSSSSDNNHHGKYYY